MTFFRDFKNKKISHVIYNHEYQQNGLNRVLTTLEIHENNSEIKMNLNTCT